MNLHLLGNPLRDPEVGRDRLDAMRARPHIITAAALGLALTGGSMATWGDPWEAAAHRELNRAISPQPNNEHLMRLSALRALRDQRLEPLLISLTSDSDASIQIHALLGLAELSEDGSIDARRLTAASPAAREAAITLGLADGRIDAATIEHLLGHANISPTTDVQLLSGLLQHGQPLDPQRLYAVDTQGDDGVAARRAALLACIGDVERHQRISSALHLHADAGIAQW